MKEQYLTITPLGGLGEIGMNCQKWETEQGIVLVDCGFMFPDDALLGIDVVIPRFESVFSESEHILGIVLTHGHEDHIGALPWLLLQYKSLRGIHIYGSPFTISLVEHKLEEQNLLDRVSLISVHPYETVSLGSLTFHFIPVIHSIPQCYALAVETPIGKVIHSGDFKLDSCPLDSHADSSLEDFRQFAEAGEQKGIKLFLSDSTNIEITGHSLPEKAVRDALDNIFSEEKGRIVIALFSSHIRRIQSVFELAKKYNRTVFVSGKSLSINIEKAAALGIIDMPEEFYTEAEGFPDIPPENTVVLATGTQGEALSALARIARGEHKKLTLHEGDTVIMSSRVIPGNARAVCRILNQIYKLGATVYHSSQKTVHATGHACREELKKFIQTIQPDHFIPIHGEYRHLALHAQLAQECGIPKDHVHIIEDGQPITLNTEGVFLGEPISVESVLVDGKGVGDVGRMVLKERRILGEEGLVVVNIIIAEETGELLYGPEMLSRGFIFGQQYNHVLEDAKCIVIDQFENITPGDIQKLSDGIRTGLRRFFRDVLSRDPIVLPIISRISIM